jgi:hypothetical protein
VKKLTERRGLAIGGAILILLAAFAGGYLVADDAGEVSDLEDTVAALESERDEAEDDLAASEDSGAELEDELASTSDQLEAERSLNGKSEKTQQDGGEYETDFPWQGAGTVGYLTIKPIDFAQEGSKWILTVEAKNEGSEPKQPFCGGAEAVLIDAENNNYTGEAVLSESSDNCGEELQPGLTGTFKSEFRLPDGAKPVAAAIYGDYEQEEEARTWELP